MAAFWWNTWKVVGQTLKAFDHCRFTSAISMWMLLLWFHLDARRKPEESDGKRAVVSSGLVWPPPPTASSLQAAAIPPPPLSHQINPPFPILSCLPLIHWLPLLVAAFVSSNKGKKNQNVYMEMKTEVKINSYLEGLRNDGQNSVRVNLMTVWA